MVSVYLAVVVTIIVVILFLFLNAMLYTLKAKADDSGIAKIISIYLWAMFSIQVLSEILSFLNSYTLFISHVYFYSQFILISIFYHKICENNSQRVFIRWYVSGVTLCLLIQYFIYPEVSYRYNLLEVFLTNYSLVICPLMYIYNTTPENRTFSYLNLGFLTYGISGGTIFLFGNIMSFTPLEMSELFYLIHIITLLFLYTMQLLQWVKLFGKKSVKIKS